MIPRTALVVGALTAATSALFAASGDTASAADFHSSPPGAAPKGWTPFGAASWSIVKQGPGSVYQAEGSAFPGAFASIRAFDLPQKTEGFTLSTTFRITRGTAKPGGEYIGLAAFATQPNLAGASYYVADVQRGSGILRIISLGEDNPDFSAEKIEEYVGALTENTDYTLTLAVTPAANGGVALKLTLSDGTTTTRVDAKDPTPLAGRHFGPRLNNVTNGDPLRVSFADFVLTPATPKAP